MKNKLLIKKLAIGTAQFGLINYGVANKNKKNFNQSKVNKIINFCKKKKIFFLDTARVYGDSEKKLGLSGVEKFSVITKVPKLDLNLKFSLLKDQFNHFFFSSLRDLKINKIYAVLFHNEEQLLLKEGRIIYELLNNLKKNNFTEKIGVSFHNPIHVKKIMKKYKFDIAEVPFNIFDNRIYRYQIVEYLKKKSVDIFCRSVFLQGLLLMKFRNLPKSIKKNILVKSYFYDTSDNINKKIYLCLNHIFFHKDINKIIIGIDNIQHLKKIINFIKKIKPKMCEKYYNKDLHVIDPLKW